MEKFLENVVVASLRGARRINPFGNDRVNLDAFAAPPAAYAPQYGGYGAWAAAQAYIAPTETEA
jgi:hypothetical protein